MDIGFPVIEFARRNLAQLREHSSERGSAAYNSSVPENGVLSTIRQQTRRGTEHQDQTRGPQTVREAYKL